MHTYLKPSLVLPMIVILLCYSLLSIQGDSPAGFTEELLCLLSKLALWGPYFALLLSSPSQGQRQLGVPQYLFFPCSMAVEISAEHMVTEKR